MPASIFSRFCKTRVIRGCFWSLFLLFALAHPLSAQYQKTPPDFGGTYAFPSPTHPEPTADWMRALDVGLLAVGLGFAAWLILKSRSRRGVMLLSIASVAYFGFYRKGCICAVGAIQNVVLCLVTYICPIPRRDCDILPPFGFNALIRPRFLRRGLPAWGDSGSCGSETAESPCKA